MILLLIVTMPAYETILYEFKIKGKKITDHFDTSAKCNLSIKSCEKSNNWSKY